MKIIFNIVLAAQVASLCSCMWRIDPMHPLIRSDIIESLDQEKLILAKAKLSIASDGRTKIVFVRGTPYERGYQQGALLRDDIADNIGYL